MRSWRELCDRCWFVRVWHGQLGLRHGAVVRARDATAHDGVMGRDVQCSGLSASMHEWPQVGCGLLEDECCHGLVLPTLDPDV